MHRALHLRKSIVHAYAVPCIPTRRFKAFTCSCSCMLTQHCHCHVELRQWQTGWRVASLRSRSGECCAARAVHARCLCMLVCIAWHPPLFVCLTNCHLPAAEPEHATCGEVKLERNVLGALRHSDTLGVILELLPACLTSATTRPGQRCARRPRSLSCTSCTGHWRVRPHPVPSLAHPCHTMTGVTSPNLGLPHPARGAR